MTVAGVLGKPAGRIVLVAALCVLIYAMTFSTPFIFDDELNITKNQRIADLRTFFGTHSLSDTRFIGILSFALNRSIGGVNVEGYHAVNIAIHLLNALLLMGIAGAAIDNASGNVPSGNSPAPHALAVLWAGIFFAVHPVQTQAVTYIVQRFSSLAALFCLLAFFSYLRFITSQGRARRAMWYAACIVSLVLGMKTKENTFTFPLIIALYDLMALDALPRERAARLLPILLTLPVVPLSLYLSGSSAGAVLGSTPGANQLARIPERIDYLLTEGPVIATYLRLVLFPLNQNLDYDYPVYSVPAAWPLAAWLLHIIIIALASAAALRARTQGKNLTLLACFGVLWFYIALSVESSLVPIQDVIFEHRLYLPLAGLAISASAGFLMIFSSLTFQNRSRFAAMSFVVIACFAVMAAARNAEWQSSLSIWQDTAFKSPLKARPHNNLGNIYYAENRLEDAAREYVDAARLDPYYADPHYNLANVLESMNRLQEAIAEYQVSIRIYPAYVDAYYNLGLIAVKLDLPDEAMRAFSAAARFSPCHTQAHNNIGVILVGQGQIDKAEEEFRKAVSCDPTNAQARVNLDAVLAKKTGR